MARSSTKRDALRAGGSLSLAALAGCFGIAHRLPPDDGTIHVWDEEWAAGKTLRVVARRNGNTALEESFELPIDDPAVTISPATYQVTVYLDQATAASEEWDVTSCTSELYIGFGEEPEDGVSIDTSHC